MTYAPRDELQAIIAHDPQVLGHEFVQDPDDIPGGRAVCWQHLEGIDAD